MSCLNVTHYYLSTLRIIVAPQKLIMLFTNVKLRWKKLPVEVNEQLIRLVGKTENPEKIIAQQDLWHKKVTEMNDKTMHEAQSYKMSLEASSFLAAGITGSKGSLQQTRSEASSRSHKTRDSEARVSENRSKVSNKSKDSRKLDSHKYDKSASTRHTSTVRTMSFTDHEFKHN